MRLKKSIKRGIAAVTITGIMASSAMPAFAKDYHIDYGDIKVDQDKVSYTDKDGTKYDNEKNEDGDITITGKSDENTVSVKDADVTFKDLEIDRSASSTAADGAAVSVSGNSSIELDGKNTISSGMGHAGIEKADDNGTMTIKDDNNVSGSLTANGGFGGAGIGGGNNADGSDITITAARSLPTAALAEPASAVEAAASPAAATALTLPFPAAMSRPTAARLVQASAAVMAIMPTV